MSVTFTDFKEFGLPTALVEDLTRMGFLAPTPIQAAGIPAIMSGKDLLALAPTGTGKTGAFGIPALANIATQSEKQVLILAPTRELAAQIFEFIKNVTLNRKVKGALLVGGEPIRKQYFDWSNGADFIVATPGRLMDHVGRGLDLGHVGILILDEIDRMLDMGFAPQVEEIVKRIPTERQTLFFSATMPAEIQRLAARYLKDPVRITVGGKPEDAPKIREEKIQVSGYKKIEALFEQVKNYAGKMLIFTRTQGGTDQVAEKLEEAGVEAARLHGGRTQAERKRALDAFRRGRVRVLVATDIAARGIDVADIEVVINFDKAATREDHLHRIGRTGRYGKEGVAITFMDGRSNGRSVRTGRGFGQRGRYEDRRPFTRERDDIRSPEFGKLLAQSDSEGQVVSVQQGSGPRPQTFGPPRRDSRKFESRRPFGDRDQRRPFGGDRGPRRFDDRAPGHFGDREPREGFRDRREGVSGSVRFFRANDAKPAFPKKKREVLASSFPPKKSGGPNFVRGKKAVVRKKTSA